MAQTPSRVDVVIQPPPPPPKPEPTPLDVLVAVAWPLTVLVCIVLLRSPLSAFLTGISGRVTKLSLWNVAVELSSARQMTGVSLDEIKDPAWIPAGDSGQALRSHLTQPGGADYAMVDIGNGDEWLTSRLYLLAAMSERMRGIRQIVFASSVPGQPHPRFIGNASVRNVRFLLAMKFPWLEEAFSQAYSQAIQNSMPTGALISNTGALNRTSATRIISDYIMILQNPGAGAPTELTPLTHGRVERAYWVTEEVLTDVLGSDLKRDSVSLQRERTNEERIRALLGTQGELIPAVSVHGGFERMVNRRELLERLAREVASSK